MSGPVTTHDAVEGGAGAAPDRPAPALELLDGRRTEVGGMGVARVLPKRQRRTVGAWCFADHFGPADVAETSMQIGPHPHIGLHTVTWILSGEVVHRDSLGSEQPIRPGQLNLMTAGGGVAHAEETPERLAGRLHGVQLWVAQPEGTRWGPAAFEHHPDLPRVEVDGAEGTVLVGEFAGARSTARADTPLVGVELAVRGPATVPLDDAFEHAAVVVEGALRIDGSVVEPGALAYLGRGRAELAVEPAVPGTRALVLGGEPFGEEIVMWWNFVGRSTDELDDAYREWEEAAGRFGKVASNLARMPAPRPRWQPLP